MSPPPKRPKSKTISRRGTYKVEDPRHRRTGRQQLVVTSPSGKRFLIRGAFRPYFSRAIVETTRGALGKLRDESRRTGRSRWKIFRERATQISKRSEFTDRPVKTHGVRAAVRYFLAEGNVSSDAGYAELGAEYKWAAKQFSKLINHHLRGSRGLQRLELGPENFFIGAGNTGVLQNVSDAMSIWRPFRKRKPGTNPVLLDSAPSYWGFGPQLAAGSRFERSLVRFDRNFEEKFIKRMNRIKPDIAFLMSPHNPTGKPVPDREIVNIANNTPNQTVLFVDLTIASGEGQTRTPLKRVADLMRQINPEKKVLFFVSTSKDYQMVRPRVGVACTTNPDLTKFLNNPSTFEHLRKGFANAIRFDKKTLSAAIVKAMKRITATELGVSPATWKLVGGYHFRLENAALREGHRILRKRAKGLGLQIDEDAVGTFALIGLPKNIPGQELIDWFERNKHPFRGKNLEDMAMTLDDIKKNQLRIYLGNPKSLDRWLNYVELFLIEKGVIQIPSRRRKRAV